MVSEGWDFKVYIKKDYMGDYRGGIREYFRESKIYQIDSGRVSMSQEWSRVVSAEVKEEYMTFQGIQTHCSQLTSQNQKTDKSHLSLTLMRVKLVYPYF